MTAPTRAPLVELVGHSASENLTQVFTGFGLLHRQGAIRLHLRRDGPFRTGVGVEAVLRAVVDGEHRLVFDLNDGGKILEDERAWCTTYLKRSYEPGGAGVDERVVPLGLNYPVYGPGDRRGRRLLWSLAGARPSTIRGAATQVVRLNGALSWVLRPNGGCRTSEVHRIEAPPAVSDRPVAIGFTRQWDPSRVAGEKAEEWRAMNDLRAGCVRLLRRELGPSFTGGLEPSPFAVRHWPDLVADPRLTGKAAYLAAMRQADVGVTSGGLRGSLGWRLGEYVAASRAVVTEHPRYTVPGRFEAGTNYLGFSTPEECVAATVELLGDADRRLAMMEANQRYYEGFVRPDRLVGNALAAALAGPGTTG